MDAEFDGHVATIRASLAAVEGKLYGLTCVAPARVALTAPGDALDDGAALVWAPAAPEHARVRILSTEGRSLAVGEAPVALLLRAAAALPALVLAAVTEREAARAAAPRLAAAARALASTLDQSEMVQALAWMSRDDAMAAARASAGLALRELCTDPDDATRFVLPGHGYTPPSPNRLLVRRGMKDESGVYRWGAPSYARVVSRNGAERLTAALAPDWPGVAVRYLGSCDDPEGDGNAVHCFAIDV